jgi:hypothetical protein
MPLNTESRSSQRLPLELPMRVRWRSGEGQVEEAQGTTGNISANGVFFTLPARLSPETRITFRVLLPSDIAKTPIELVGQGRVVRQSRRGEVQGVAAIIDDYQLVSPRKGKDKKPRNGFAASDCSKDSDRAKTVAGH